MNQHKEFILTPLSNILQEAVLACNSISHGIESYPLAEYMFQSIFIKISGAQEQKLRCLQWEIAINDFQFRYKMLENKGNKGFSSYENKNSHYKELIKQITKIKDGYIIDNKRKIIDEPKIQNVIAGSILEKWSPLKYREYLDL